MSRDLYLESQNRPHIRPASRPFPPGRMSRSLRCAKRRAASAPPLRTYGRSFSRRRTPPSRGFAGFRGLPLVHVGSYDDYESHRRCEKSSFMRCSLEGRKLGSGVNRGELGKGKQSLRRLQAGFPRYLVRSRYPRCPAIGNGAGNKAMAGGGVIEAFEIHRTVIGDYYLICLSSLHLSV